MRETSANRVASGFFLVGFLFAILFQLGFVKAHKCDLSMLINVGEASPARPSVERDYGPVCVVNGIGHDGVWTYLLARDPLLRGKTAAEISQFGESAAYRGRRILMSAIGGALGSLSPHATVWGLMIVGAIGVGLSAYVVAYWMAAGGHSPFVLLSVFLNVGILCSLKTFTPDHLALGLAMIGLLLGLTGKRLLAMGILALAGLTKEMYLLSAFSLFLIDLQRHSLRSSIILLLGAVAPLVLWLLYLHSVVPDEPVFALRSNLGLPFVGILASIPTWGELQGSEDKVYHVVIISCAVALSIATSRLGSSLFAALTSPWLLLLVCMSSLVWDVGNNAVRAGSMVILLLGLAPMVQTIQSTGRSMPTPTPS